MATLHIMVGVSGSGKSTMVADLTDKITNRGGAFSIVSADKFFGRNYDFVGAELKWAHGWCQGTAALDMKRGVTDVIIDNTNVVQEHIKPYLEMANHFEYDVEYYITHNELTEEQLEEFAERNVHGVPLEVIKRQYENFKRDWM